MTPDGWEVVSLQSIADVSWGNTSITKASYVDQGYPAYSASGQDGCLDAFEHNGNGIVLSAIGARCGRCFFASGKWTSIKNTITIKVEKGNRADIKFLYQHLNRDRVWPASGGAQPFIGLGNARKMEILVPPLPEQKKIAAILGSVDEAIQATQKVIDQTRKVKQGLLAQLLTRGIGHTRFKKTEIGEIPEEWEATRLGDICTKITDGSHQAVRTSDEGTVPFLYVSCVRDEAILWDQASRISQEVYKEISRGREPIPGAVLYTAVGSYGHAALIRSSSPFSFQRHIAYLLPDSLKVISSFVVSYLNSVKGRQYADMAAVGNAQKTVTLRELSRFPFPLPPIDEQRRIHEIVNSVSHSIRVEESRMQMLRGVKRGLMQDLLTGRVRVKGVA